MGKTVGTLMPYATTQAGSYDRLDKQMILFDIGVNWFLKGNTSKVTLDYQNRPTYQLAGNELIRDASRKAQYVLQYQFFF